MRGWKVVALASALTMLIACVAPRPAAANSLTDGLIIGGITAGVVATVIIVAILVEGNKEPEPELLGFMPIESSHKAADGLRAACLQPDGTRALLCW